MLCVEFNVVWCRDVDTRQNEQKRLEAFEMWLWRRMENIKWTDKIKNAIMLERVGEGRIILELIKKKKRDWLGHWLRRNFQLKEILEEGSRQKISDDRQHHDKWTVCRYVKEVCEEVRVENAEFTVKDLPLGKIL